MRRLYLYFRERWFKRPEHLQPVQRHRSAGSPRGQMKLLGHQADLKKTGVIAIEPKELQ